MPWQQRLVPGACCGIDQNGGAAAGNSLDAGNEFRHDKRVRSVGVATLWSVRLLWPILFTSFVTRPNCLTVICIERRILGNFGTHNFGNECTLHAMLEGARRHLPGAELVGVGNDPADIEKRHGVPALSISPDPTLGFKGVSRGPQRLRRVAQELKDWLRVMREVRNIDMLVITGTGMLTDNHDGNFGMPYQMFKWVVTSWLWRRKVAFVSVGAEGLNDRMKLFFLHWSLRLAQFRSYRDPLSETAGGAPRRWGLGRPHLS